MKYLKTYEDLKTDLKEKSPVESNHTEDCQCSNCVKKREEQERIYSSQEKEDYHT